MSGPEDGAIQGGAMEAHGADAGHAGAEGAAQGGAQTWFAGTPQKGGSRSNPSDRILIASYIPMTQPSEPPRSPFKVHTPLTLPQRVLCAPTSPMQCGGPVLSDPCAGGPGRPAC